MAIWWWISAGRSRKGGRGVGGGGGVERDMKEGLNKSGLGIFFIFLFLLPLGEG